MTDRSEITSTYSRRDTLRMMALTGAAGLVAPNLLGKPAFGQTAPASPTGRIVVGLSQEPTVFNPLMTKIEVDDGVHFSLFDALLRIDPKGVFQPNLAVEVPTRTTAASRRTASNGASACGTTSAGTTASPSPPRT
jgi:peptide/nickel transport system substrate-binding protein